MFELLINTLSVCLSLLAWLILGLTLFAFLRLERKRKRWLMIPGKRRVTFIIVFCIVFLLKLWFSSAVLLAFFNLAIILLGGYIFHRSFFHQYLKRKVSAYIFPHPRSFPSESGLLNLDIISEEYDDKEEIDDNSVKNPIILSEEKIKAVHDVLESPDFLYTPGITLNLLARNAAINCTYLSRYFNCQLGMSFPEYITMRRLDRAEDLLRSTDMKIVEILEQVGFQNSSTFYQAFNNRYGLTPVQWRKQMT